MSPRFINVIVLLFFCQFFSTQCNVTKINNPTESSTTIDGKWELNKFHNLNIEINQSYVPTLEVNIGDKKITGSDGCNNIYARLSKLTNQEIGISAIGGTKIGCKMKYPYDDEYKNLLRTARTYKIYSPFLILFDNQDVKLLEFEKIKE